MTHPHRSGGAVVSGGGPVILVHGGAGRHPEPTRPDKIAGVERAARIGWEVLAGGGSAIEAVERATTVLEDNPLFDAGIGSYLNRDGEVELDAIIVDGETLTFGAVAAVQRVRSPITLARRVMSDSPHAMLAGAGAERFARRLGLTAPSAALIDPEIFRRWREARSGAGQGEPSEYTEEPPGDFDVPRLVGETGDTVGAVALDARGRLAAATSTGGTKDKWPGRVGDSPIIGSGAWAEGGVGAISSTGHGESIMRTCLAYRVAAELRAGASARAAAHLGVADLEQITGGEAGLIVIDGSGRLGWSQNTEGMPFAWRCADRGGTGI